MAGAITLMEITVHGWDLATATGQSYSLDEDVAAAAFETVKQLTAVGRDGGAFGAEVSADSGASTLKYGDGVPFSLISTPDALGEVNSYSRGKS